MFSLRFAVSTTFLFLILFLASQAVSAQLIISEFRVRGPNGANDEFIELYNNSGADHIVAGGGTGTALECDDLRNSRVSSPPVITANMVRGATSGTARPPLVVSTGTQEKVVSSPKERRKSRRVEGRVCRKSMGKR